MKIVQAEVTFIFRSDMRKAAWDKHIDDVGQMDVKDREIVERAEILIYEDISGRTKVLKNRY